MRLTAALSFAAILITSAFGATSASAAFGISAFDGAVLDQEGKASRRAGGHPAEASVSFSLNEALNQEGAVVPDGGGIKNVDVELPPGLVGNPQAVPACSSPDAITKLGFTPEVCPVNTIIGLAQLKVDLFGRVETQLAPVFNMEPPDGVAAEFAFTVLKFPTVVDATVRSDGDYGIDVRTRYASQGLSVLGSTVTLWGTPAAPVHDAQRCYVFPFSAEELLAIFGAVKCFGAPGSVAGPNPSNVVPRAYLTNPTACTPAGIGLETRMLVESWNPNSAPAAASFVSHEPPGYSVLDPRPSSEWGPPQGPTGCEEVPFDPVATLRPDTSQADSPSGFAVDIAMPTDGLLAPSSIAQSHLKKAVVTLAEGMTVNPSSAAGLGSCSPAQLADETVTPQPGEGCPNSSKIGTVEIETPLLDEPVTGSVFLARQNDNPFNSLLALYIVVRNVERGIVIKLPGRVDPDPRTGRLTATFDDNPQLPFSNLHLDLKSGSRAPLITPAKCGSYKIETELYPWARPNEPVHSKSTFEITSGPNGTPCPAQNQLHPSFEAGTVTPIAGDYSPLVVNASRPDGSQPLTGINLQLPPGLTGKLAGIPYCSDAGIAQAGGRNQPGQGAQEIASPSCPAASQVGSVDVAAGAGSTPYHVQGKAYLAGPYRGAPLSLVVITPAVAGPFDLGVVVVRAALAVNPVTAQISASSDPIPQILHGIPLKIRSISVNADRPDFTLNPTNCEPMSLTGKLFGPSASAPVANRFQVGACKALDFKPRLALRVFGKTNRNAKPRFRAILQARPGEANIARAQVNLPHSLFLEQSHIKTVCTRVQWNQGAGHGSACPQGSIYGHARAWTPLLDQPLQGPVYLRSSAHKLPDLVAALNGQVDIELAGKVDSGKNHGLRNTFEVVPDAPVSKFVLEMKGKRKGLLVNSENLCSKQAKTRAIVRFTGQNGAVHQFKPKVRNGCGKKKHRRHGKHRSR